METNNTSRFIRDCMDDTCTHNKPDDKDYDLLEQIRDVIIGTSNIQFEISGVKNYGTFKQNFRVKFSDGIMREGVVW